MPDKLYEGMTRTKESTSRGPKGIYAVLAVLVTLLTLALIWGSVLGGQSSRVVQAQSAGGEADAYAQAEANLEGLTEPRGEREPSYAAFGDKDNPFIPVVAQAEAEDASAEAGNGEAEAGSGSGGGDGSSIGSNAPANSQDAGQDQAQNASRPASQNVTDNRNDTVSGSNGNCANLQEFDRLLCEEKQGESVGNNGPPNSGSRQGAPGSGGSGSSGVGDPTQNFRNGGGGAAK